MKRRQFLAAGAATAVLLPQVGNLHARPATHDVIRPPRLKPGDTVGLINPAGATYEAEDIRVVNEVLEALGLHAHPAPHVLDRYGYLAGRDPDRAGDINAMFADPGINAVMAVRGGWGCNRLLSLLDYDTIKRHPKILVGYSDITSLLVAITSMTGMVTFHGPVGTSTWNRFSVDYFKKVLMDGATPVMENPHVMGDGLAQTKDRISVLRPGTARGTLYGGNLSVLTAMLGSSYLPSWNGVILFVEEDGEHIYRVDRMITQLRLAGVLDHIAGFVMGKCTNCTPGEGYGSLTMEDVLADLVTPLGIPAFTGAMIGHIENKFTLPVGGKVEIDAGKGTIALLEPAVS
jgi:muramoyltetrapeptide carboxypeptidase